MLAAFRLDYFEDKIYLLLFIVVDVLIGIFTEDIWSDIGYNFCIRGQIVFILTVC